MGLFSFRRKALTASPAVVEAIRNGQVNQYRRLGGVNQQVNAAWLQTQSASYAYMFESQPAVRKVIDYIARNVSQLGLKLYERRSDTDRKRDADHPAALTMAQPNDLGPADQFIYDLVADFLVHDNAYVLKFRGANGGPRTMIRVPPTSVGVNGNGRFLVESYRIYRSDATYIDVSPGDVLHWRGYNPSDPRMGISRLETLRQILSEDSAAQTANVELLKSGLSKPGYIKRPLEAPDWSEDARKGFQEAWANQAKSSPRKTPVLEEGMEFADFGISPKDAEMLDGRRFTNEEVASLYGLAHVPPEGEEERRAFYADVLPPLTQSLGQQLDFSLLRAEYAEDDYYFEFDLNEKLRGEPEKRFSAITAAVGRPWQSVNEARSLENLPPVDGGDELVTPLNVIVGDNPKPAPNVMGPQDPNGPEQDGSHREESAKPEIKALETSSVPRRIADMNRQGRYIGEMKSMLEGYYERQGASLKSAKASASTERWNRELADDLEKLVRSITEREGGIYAGRLGGDDFDMRQVKNYIRKTAEDVARKLNAATAADISEYGVSDAIDRARGERTIATSAALGARMTGFARVEAAKQAPGTAQRQKTWMANTERHANLDGASVPLNSDWGGIEPGSEPGCACGVLIT